MATNSRSVTAATLGAWLVKGNRDVSPVDELIRSKFSTVDSWCLQQTYRTDLVGPGQPVFFWVSGASTTHPAGIYAQGRTTGSADLDVADDGWVGPSDRGRQKLLMPVKLIPLSAPVLRKDLLTHPILSEIEVLRVPAGSNPSFITSAALAALRADWPQVTSS